MSTIVRLTETQLKDLIKSIVAEAKDDDNFIQKAVAKSEKKGTKGKFGQWCKDHGFGEEVSMKCINKAMKSEDGGVVKMANFAKNIGGYKGAKH
jgi:hypothetical protein